MQKFWKYKLDHVIFWIITIGFHIYTRFFLINEFGAGGFILEIIIRNSLLAGVIYLNLLVLIPQLLQRKKVVVYSISLLGALILYGMLKNIHDQQVYPPEPGKDEQLVLLDNIFYNFSIALFYVSFSVGIQLSKEWFFQRDFIRKIELEKLNTELAYLKSQINPHFLFNSLNTIFFQIDKTNQEARNTLSQFSEMLRFQLYECEGNLIPLEKEILYLKNYVDLQRLRKDENYKINFTVSGDLKGNEIAPLLLIPFVENAFKHGSHFGNTLNETIIAIEVNGEDFSIAITNTKENKVESNTGGIGLKNAKRRLELQYPSRHQLAIKDKGEKFEVHLNLKLV